MQVDLQHFYGRPVLRGSARRFENMRRLVAELSVRDMCADEVAELLGFTLSGARKYLRPLLAAGIIELDRYVGGTAAAVGKAVYRLARDPEPVRGFMSALAQPRGKGKKAPPDLPSPSRAPRNGRLFHIMQDDGDCLIRVSRAPVRRDPLVEALFGAPKRGADRMPVARPATNMA